MSSKNIAILDILDRLKSVLSASKDIELSQAIGIKQNTLSGWKSRGSFDFPLIIEFCDTHNINLDWLITGNGTKLRSQGDLDIIKEEPTTPGGTMDDDPEVAKLLEMTRQIVKSDTNYGFSLVANIRSFHQAMISERRFNDLEKRIARIEERTDQSKKKASIRKTDPSDQKEDIIKRRAM